MHTRLSSRTKLIPERGSATVASLAIVLALAVALIVIGAVSTVMKNRIHAQGAADLAALAAAEQWNYYAGEPCEVARVVTTRNGAQLSDCKLHGASVQVEVVIAQDLIVFGAIKSATAVARAGPAES